MAEKRMFSKSVICSDTFYKLSATSRDLYFQLNMEADDEGFVSNVNSIMKKIDAKSTDLGQLVKKNLIIRFKNGVLVIVHWYINNSIRSDRKKETIYKEEKSKLSLCSNGFYVLNKVKKEEKMTTKMVDNATTKRQPSDRHDDNLDKNRLDESSIDKCSKDESNIVESSIEHSVRTRETSSEQFNELTNNLFEIINKKIKVPLTNFLTNQFKFKITQTLKSYILKDESNWILVFTKAAEITDFTKNMMTIYTDFFVNVQQVVDGGEW